MAKGKKTVSVEYLVNKVNNTLKGNGMNQTAKSALCGFIETILLDSNNYGGYCHTNGISGIVTPETEFNREYFIKPN